MSESPDDRDGGWRMVAGEWRLFQPKPIIWIDTDAEHGRRMERIDADVKVKIEADRRAAAAQRLAADEAGALQLMKRDDPVPGYRALADVLLRKHTITADWRTVMPEGVAAFAEIWKRNIVVPPITDGVTFAVFCHECGHVLSEQCRGGLHRRDERERFWWHCLRCEFLGWEKALTLAPFSREMFDRLRSSLRIYRGMTPAPAAAIAELDRLRGNITFQRARQARVNQELMQERQDLVAKWRREARR